MNNDQLYFYNRGFNDCLAKFVDAHPAKTLTDEEITDIASTLLIATDAIEYEWGVCVVEFARAILRKAQE
jgi:tRNA U34 2-thiouridine synthase MnmA/TrmU